MYLKILLNNSLPIKDRIKNLISYIQIKRAANIAWGSRYRKVFNVHKEFNKQLDREGEKMHKKNWKPFSGNVNISTYRVCNHISGSSNPEFLPEEIFMADIQPSLITIMWPSIIIIKVFIINGLRNLFSPMLIFTILRVNIWIAICKLSHLKKLY